MSRFSQPAGNSNRGTTVNYEGEKAYGLSPELELYSAVCAASLQPKFYTPDTGETLKRIQKLIQSNSPEFVAKLAVYARNQMHLRSIPIVLLVELERIHRTPLIRKLAYSVIQRADELNETLSYYQTANSRTGTRDKLCKLGNQLRLGIADACHKFDEYQYGKYNRKTEVNFKRVLKLTHPKPTSDEESALFKKIIDDTLETPYTWETELSRAGETGANKTAVWEGLIDSKRVGYMATLRNLRNILQAEVSSRHLDLVCEFISDPEAVTKSKQLPFRFLSAYLEISKTPSFGSDMVLSALERAVIASAENIPISMDERVVIACDVSGSMETSISPRSSVQYFDIGLILGMLLKHKCKQSISGMFGETWKPIQVPSDNILKNAVEFHQRTGEVGYSTNGHEVIGWMIESKIHADRVMMFTDCQMWDSDIEAFGINLGSPVSRFWNQYVALNPGARLYLFDLSGYGNTPISTVRPDVSLISGWSDKVFDVLDAIENGGTAIQKIKEIEVVGY